MVRLLLFLLLCSVGYAAGEPATLQLEGQTLFEFKVPVGSVPPKERVRLIEARLEKLLQDRLFTLEQLKTEEEKELGWKILAGENLLLVITKEDAKADGRSGRIIAESIVFRLKEIIETDRVARSPRELLIHSLYALLYTLGLILLLVALRLAQRRGLSKIDAWQGTLIPSVRIKSFELLPAERIARILRWILGAIRLVLTLLLLYFYLPLVLRLFPWTARLSPLLIGYVTTPLKQIFSGFVLFVPNLFFIAITFLVTRYVLKFIRLFFAEIEKGTLQFTGFYPEWAEPTYQLVRVLAIAFSLVIIYPYIPGSGSAAFQGISVFLGVLVSLGSSSAVANIISGLVLTYMRSFRIGDRVKIADSVGDVLEKTLLVTRIRTIKNVEVTIPNSLVLGSHIVNFSGSAQSLGLILHSEVTIGYDAPWKQVHELLINAALRTEGILKEPAPFVLQTALEDSYVRYQINGYTRQANSMSPIYSALHANIQDAFNAAGVEIMSPSYSAIRDGNTVTIPEAQRKPGYEAPAFRVKHTDPAGPTL